MVRVLVVGDSRTGKSKMMHLATTGTCPLNLFTNRRPETFVLRGTTLTAQFCVVHGSASDEHLHAEIERGADAIVIVFKNSARSARTWLARCTRGHSTSLPILICQHNSSCEPGPLVVHLLRHYPTAEFTVTRSCRVAGLSDCANRIVRRARAEPGSPLRFPLE
jgi:hypothetical protein